MKELDFEPGDKLTTVLNAEDNITLKTTKYPTVSSLRGAAGKLKVPLSWEEMRQMAREDR